jgi:hypothetical protein
MSTVISDNTQRVVKFVQDLLLDEDDRAAITPAVISEKIAMVVAMSPRWGIGLDHDQVIDELIRRFSIWMGQDTTIKSDVGHEAWLTSSRKTDWRYWQRYRDWLEAKLSWKATDALDKSTDAILGLLEDPDRSGPWDRRGMVVGHVQSGKTGSYTGLICKAADAGYRIIIVLAGMHNNLRSQTQVRLDEGFLGFATNPDPEVFDFVGVGKDGRDSNIKPNCATNRTETGDFNTKIARHLAITPEQRPWLFVVKKNKTVLQRLLDWIRNHAADTTDPVTGKKVVTRLPLLVIDDEADHASVDTGEQIFLPDGTPDEDHTPTAINSRVRKILNSFTRSAYVGYTATPFANIFIHEKGATLEEGPDLFPAAFIINLAAPSNYVGPARVFGLPSPEGRHGGLPLVREILDVSTDDGHGGWMPQRHRNGHVPGHSGPDELPPSLIQAVDAFVLACAARRLRDQEKEHCSMLVHVTRFNSVQWEVHRQVSDHLRRLRQRISRSVDHEDAVERLKSLWENDFVPTTKAVHASDPELGPTANLSWMSVLSVLPDAMADIDVRMINGTAKDALDYVLNEGKGLKVIAIGGDKLSRGLTLEGLCVSYFLRASKMYDTLMQMGRWFGYRSGYLDLSRLYTTPELIEWFGHITDASEELREEFEMMASSGATPREYGLKVQSHPVLTITSPLKMRTARNLMLSFSGQLLETVSLYRDRNVLQRNLDAARRLVSTLGTPEVSPVRLRDGGRQNWVGGYLWENCVASEVVNFLTAYRTHPEAHKVNSAVLAEFIQSMAAKGELTHWTVALIGGGEGGKCTFAPSVVVDMIQRTNNSSHADRYSIGRLLSPRDEAIDLDEAAWMAALEATRQAWHLDPGRLRSLSEPDAPNGPAVRRIRGFGAEGVAAHPERGLLLMYALDPQKADLGLPDDTPPVVAIGVSFPGSNKGLKVEYKVNNVLWAQEYGPAD